VAYVVILFALGLLGCCVFYRLWAGKNKKKYLEARKSKMAVQFKMSAKFELLLKNFFASKQLTFIDFFFSKIQDGAHIQ
jgi:hypothetical protein